MDNTTFMSAIKDMESQIMEEVTGAQEYMSCSDHWKDNPTVSTNYLAMAKQELDHAKKLTDMLPMIKGAEEFSEDQKVIVNFLSEMNNDQIRRISNR